MATRNTKKGQEGRTGGMVRKATAQDDLDLIRHLLNAPWSAEVKLAVIQQIPTAEGLVLS
jgi:hypothetical protein